MTYLYHFITGSLVSLFLKYKVVSARAKFFPTELPYSPLNPSTRASFSKRDRKTNPRAANFSCARPRPEPRKNGSRRCRSKEKQSDDAIFSIPVPTSCAVIASRNIEEKFCQGGFAGTGPICGCALTLEYDTQRQTFSVFSVKPNGKVLSQNNSLLTRLNSVLHHCRKNI